MSTTDIYGNSYDENCGEVPAVARLQTNSELIAVASSLAIILSSDEVAKIVQQTHAWQDSDRGFVIDGHLWFDMSIQNWIASVIPSASSWQMRSYINSLLQQGILEREQLYKKHHGHNYAPRNRTYYYRLNYEKLRELGIGTVQAETNNHVGGEI